MSSLYLGANFGFVFRPDEEARIKVKEALREKAGAELYKQAKSNYCEDEPALKVDDEGRWFFFGEFGHLDAVYEGCSFDFSADELVAPDEVKLAVFDAFDKFLLNPDIPEIFRDTKHWYKKELILRVTS
jgi:hypothetical protein